MSSNSSSSNVSGSSKSKNHALYHRDNRDLLKRMAAQGKQVDSIVSDPPYGLVTVVKRFRKTKSTDKTKTSQRSAGGSDAYGRMAKGFMNSKWDGTGIERDPEFWRLCYDVLKPGAFLLAFGGTRTYHRMVCAIEDAGFIVLDTIMWMYSTGMPKNHNVAKAFDRKAGVLKVTDKPIRPAQKQNLDEETMWKHKFGNHTIAGFTPESRQWEGFGTALAPAYEPILLAIKPREGTIIENLLKHGVGALNIDGCRITIGEDDDLTRNPPSTEYDVDPKGRWPKNVVYSCACTCDDEFHDPSCPKAQFAKYGKTKSRKASIPMAAPGSFAGTASLDATKFKAGPRTERGHDDSGTIARFFYHAKVSPAERKAGLKERSTHPTMKPIKLMEWLVRLVTPPSGIVLDPFMGSGSTGIAAINQGFRFIGVEKEEEYFGIATQRLQHAADLLESRAAAAKAEPPKTRSRKAGQKIRDLPSNVIPFRRPAAAQARPPKTSDRETQTKKRVMVG